MNMVACTHSSVEVRTSSTPIVNKKAPIQLTQKNVPKSGLSSMISANLLEQNLQKRLAKTAITAQLDNTTVKLILPSYIIFTQKNTINSRVYAWLREIIIETQKTDYRHIMINGYCDHNNNSSLLDNYILTHNWADKLRVYFIEHGLPKEKLTTNGFGEFHPLATNFTFAGKLQNRRLEILIEF
jgi:OOP family OmpA-OmpF porin